MKKFFILFVFVIVTYGLSSAQIIHSPSVAKKSETVSFSFAPSSGKLPAVSTFNGSSEKNFAPWAITPMGSTSANTRIPGNTYRFQRTQYIITPDEMAASGLVNGNTIDGIGFIVFTAGVGTQTGAFKVYLMNTNDVTYSLGTNWTTAGFTEVCNITSWTVPVASGSYLVPFTGGSPFTYTGGGLYVAWEFSNPSNPIGTTALVADCNTALTNGLYGQRSSTALPTTLVASNWRPATQLLTNSVVDIVNISNIYTLEKVAPGYGTPTPIDVRVVNASSSAATFDVTITVTDPTNTLTRYTATQTVTSLAANSATILSFTGWTPTILEDVNITATTSVIAGETLITNNTLAIQSSVNTDVIGYDFDNANPSGFGFTYPGTSIFASKFHMNGTGSVIGANLVISTDVSSVGNTLYAVVLDASGNILNQSANYIIQASDLGVNKNFIFPVPPSFTNEDYFVGLAQTLGTAQWYPMGTFDENPVRSNTFYTVAISGGTPTILPATFNLKYGIEAQVGAPPNCLTPSGLSASNITMTSATISWSPSGTETEWEYVYGVSPLAPPAGSGTSTTSTSISLSGLTSGTAYQFYVRAVCGPGDYSVWNGPYSFTTLICDPADQCNYTFVLLDDYGDGWNGGSMQVLQSGTVVATLGTSFTSGDSLIQQVALCDGLGFEVFWNNAGSWPAEVGLKIYDAQSTQLYNQAIIGELLVGTTIYSGNVYCTPPACPMPVALAADNVTTLTADLSWTEAGTATSWEVEWGPTGFISGAGTMITPATNPQAISGLTANTTYQFYVRAFCNPDYSDWAGPFSFTTPCDILVAPFIEDFEVIPPPCWGVYSSTTNNWAISTSASANGVGSNSAVAQFYNFSNTTPFYLISPDFDASGLAIPTLRFDFAYATYITEMDTLNVLYSDDGGATLYLLQTMPGGVSGLLNTAGTNTSSFVPLPGEWSSIDLALPAGTNLVVFEAISAYGNNLYIDNVEIFDDVPLTKTLELNILLEGLVSGTPGEMIQAQAVGGPQFGAGIADVLTIELIDATDYVTVYYQNLNVELLVNGTATVSDIPATLDNAYYVVVKHRNSIETWSAAPVSFSGTGPFTYNFSTAAAQAYGNNQKSVAGGLFAIFAGDVNQDDIIDGSDMSEVENAANLFLQGYNIQDANGDGLVDGSDLSIIENNANSFTQVQKP